MLTCCHPHHHGVPTVLKALLRQGGNTWARGLKSAHDQQLCLLLLLGSSLAASSPKSSVLDRRYLFAYWLFFLWGVRALFITARGDFLALLNWIYHCYDTNLGKEHSRSSSSRHTQRYDTSAPTLFFIATWPKKLPYFIAVVVAVPAQVWLSYNIAGKHENTCQPANCQPLLCRCCLLYPTKEALGAKLPTNAQAYQQR